MNNADRCPICGGAVTADDCDSCGRYCGSDDGPYELPDEFKPYFSTEPLPWLSKPSLFQQGDFNLHSGVKSWLKIDCDALTDEDIETIARLLTFRLSNFGAVEGVPTGGLRLAAAMEPYTSEGPLLIVDDVLTSGGSMETHRAGRDTIGAVIFARREPPAWITPLFQMMGV